MKEFIHTAKQMFLVNRDNVVSCVIFSLFGGIAGVIVTLSVLAFNGDIADYGQIGALMAAVTGFSIWFFMGSMGLEQEFNLAISMGKTRRYFALAKCLLLAFDAVVILVLAIAVGAIEDVLYPMLYLGIPCSFHVSSVLLKPTVFLLIAFGGVSLVLFWGALVLKFTSKIYFVFSGSWILLCMVVSKIAEAAEEQQNNIWGKLAHWLENLSVVHFVGIGICVIVAGLSVAFTLLRKQRVTS